MATIPTKKISEIATLLDNLTNETLVAVAESDGLGGYVTKKVNLQKLDNVKIYADFASLPSPGKAETIYVTTDTLNLYIWDTVSSTYLKVAKDADTLDGLNSSRYLNKGASGTEYFAGANTISFTETVNTSSAGFVTIDWRTSNKQQITLTENTAFTFINPSGPCNLVLRIIQDATGGWGVIMPALKTPGGNGVAFSVTPGAVDILMLYFDGSSYIATVLNDIR